MASNVGVLRDRIEFFKPETVVVRGGKPTTTWVSQGTVFASFTAKTPKQVVVADKLENHVEYEIVVRYPHPVQGDWRLVHNGIKYDIIGAYDKTGDRQRVTIVAKRGSQT